MSKLIIPSTGLKVTLENDYVTELLIIPDLLTTEQLFTLVYRLNYLAERKRKFLDNVVVGWLVESCKIAEFTKVDFKLDIEENEGLLEVKVIYPELLDMTDLKLNPLDSFSPYL